MMGIAIPDVLAYQKAYGEFKETAGTGFEKPYKRNLRSVDVLTSVTLATTDNGTNKKKAWFKPPAALIDDPTLVSSPPTFNNDGKVPTESYYGVFGALFLIPTQYSIITNLNTMLAGLGAARHTLDIANERILDWVSSRFIGSYDSGYFVSNDNAATSLVARLGFCRNIVTPLPSVKNLSPGAQITGEMTYNLATIPVAMNVTMQLHCFAGDTGE